MTHRQTPPARGRACLAVVTLAALLGACDDSPLDPSGTDGVEPMLALAAGEDHACALTVDGEAYCWGANGLGQLGTGSLDPSAVPSPVLTAERFTSIFAGGNQTCALTDEGAAFCWGANTSGQLGSGSRTSEWEPTPVAGGIRFAGLSVGGFQHSCGWTESGDVYCWGGDRDAQLGYQATGKCPFAGGEIDCSDLPRQVALGGPAAAVSAGFLHSCALREVGTVTCWGDNSYGQIGNGSTGRRVAMTSVAGPVRLASLAAGSGHNCGLDAAGIAYCWGDDGVGAVGAPGSGLALAPVAVAGGRSYRQLVVGKGNTVLGHSCAIAADGRAYCWGADEAGQLGAGDVAMESCRGGTTPCSGEPLPVATTERWSTLAAGSGFTCGITTAGAAYCWGANDHGQLGGGSMELASTPQPVVGALRLPRAR